MKTIKVSELSGAALDWAVAKCEGVTYLQWAERTARGDRIPPSRYSTDWAQGGPIIERELICLSAPYDDRNAWIATMYIDPWDIVIKSVKTGKTPLIAAMRCYVASKLGDEVEVPEELL